MECSYVSPLYVRLMSMLSCQLLLSYLLDVLVYTACYFIVLCTAFIVIIFIPTFIWSYLPYFMIFFSISQLQDGLICPVLGCASVHPKGVKEPPRIPFPTHR